ncbi:Formylglycine-generating enzyme, required for sulfatase activity, contains SUMF1/FGE domain [Paraoerskovia marina]|uniref:Formylglycine-generating enzyme, required for sulfatase activity, contains SUMF1/FGE domain n=1 Tax=Paraoerskovia marina TaxID=545619 RepID=A0A1H1PDN6_9CELL|nr:formylglycine-generating enzyme family protein [Paraoerskovia marina]SDS08719.1 Formylglycine-generating enzyme, required for sulfatase activity, contains SUMF1/FGE domain [Paraoerskovia marina]
MPHDETDHSTEARPSCCAPSADREHATSGGPQPVTLGAPPAARRSPTGATPMPTLVPIEGGTFLMGTDDPRGYASDGEGPPHEVEVSSFAIAAHTVTVEQFAAFVEATGYVTTAEQFNSSFVFAAYLPPDHPPTRAVAAVPWWREVIGASWRHPYGPGNDVVGQEDHPAVHVSHDDALAYCAWSGTRLPTEAEWEFAARAGEHGHYPWGDEREPGGEHRMNVFQGVFPREDTGEDGWRGTCPVGTFPPNGNGLYEVTGNVWEWCADWFDPTWYARSPRHAPTGPEHGQARVTRGGSHLCHDSYCWRYRVDSRSSNTPDSSTGNMGFRVAADVAP